MTARVTKWFAVEVEQPLFSTVKGKLVRTGTEWEEYYRFPDKYNHATYNARHLAGRREFKGRRIRVVRTVETAHTILTLNGRKRKEKP